MPSAARVRCSGRMPSLQRPRGARSHFAGQVPGEADAAIRTRLPGQDVDARRADELRHVDGRRLLVDLARRAELQHHAAEHDRDPVGHGHGLGLVVGDVDRGDADPRCRSTSSRRMSWRSAASRFDSGSSIRKALGWRTMARPRATRWRWPPESWPGRRAMRWSMERSFAASSTSRRMAARRSPVPRRGGQGRARAPRPRAAA